MLPFTQAIAMNIWENKYRYRQMGRVVDQSVDDTWRRVAKAIAAAEKPQERAKWEQSFYQALRDFRFLPGGRILAGAGTQHQVTLLNCFVMAIHEDSVGGIFEALREGALTLQQGGGVGYDFSVLRPAGAVAQTSGLTASGPVSFMTVWDAMCEVLLSTGSRRGAMMAVLRCDHPDIEAFITAKKNSQALRHFNLSVMVTDAFMAALKSNADWMLKFSGQSLHGERSIKASVLWQQIIRAAYDYAEPGVLFYDTINRMNNLWYCETISATNPCGEIPLPVYGACDLGAINLTQFVRQPFTSSASVDWQALEEIVSVATRFLDDVIDVSHYPLAPQKEKAISTRRIGLGMTGLADALVMLGLRYGSDEGINAASEIMQRIAAVTWFTSIDLAKEKGVFSRYSDDYLRGQFVLTLPDEIQSQLQKYGVRNSHHNTIAPAGTISLLANNVSNGIEPIFSAGYTRHVRSSEHEQEIYHVHDYAYDLWRKQHQEAMPPAWVDVDRLTPDHHLKMQAAMQIHIDNAISKTINLPADFPFEQMTDVYTKAHALGLKGCTIYRPNEVRGTVLEAVDVHHAENKSCCS